MNILENEKSPFFYLVIFIVCVATMFGIDMMPDDKVLLDENFHLPQIRAFQKGDFNHRETALQTTPGYHALIALTSRLFNVADIKAIRYTSFFFSLPALFFYFLISRKLHQRTPILSTATFYLCPVFFPFFFIVYVDLPALSIILAGVYATLCRKYQLAGAILLLSLLLNPHNFVWLIFSWILACLQEVKSTLQWREVKLVSGDDITRCLRATWLFPCAVVIFLLSLGTGSSAIQEHPLRINTLYITQAYFWLLTVFFVLLPLHIANLGKIVDMLKQSPEWLLLGSALFAFYLLTFWAEHSYNLIEFSLHNQFLLWIKQSELHKTLIFILMFIALLSLVVTPLNDPKYYLLYPFTLLSLLPTALIDQRHYMISIALLMLFIKIDKPRIYVLMLAIYIPIITYLHSGISELKFFL